MSEHGHDHSGAAVADQYGDHAHGAGHSAASDLRFEKQEMQMFEDEDRDAGRHIGLLLALVFCIGLGLAVGVTAWTFRHHNVGHDPQEIPGAADVGNH
jgi:hypothetical protein